MGKLKPVKGTWTAVDAVKNSKSKQGKKQKLMIIEPKLGLKTQD